MSTVICAHRIRESIRLEGNLGGHLAKFSAQSRTSPGTCCEVGFLLSFGKNCRMGFHFIDHLCLQFQAVTRAVQTLRRHLAGCCTCSAHLGDFKTRLYHDPFLHMNRGITAAQAESISSFYPQLKETQKPRIRGKQSHLLSDHGLKSDIKSMGMRSMSEVSQAISDLPCPMPDCSLWWLSQTHCLSSCPLPRCPEAPSQG